MKRNHESNNDGNRINDEIAGYEQWLCQLRAEGWKAYFVTVMFNQLPGSMKTNKGIMACEIERIYATLLPRVVHHPRSLSAEGKLPIWIACPDFPVPKHKRQSLAKVTVNEGLHYHAIAVLPPTSRLTESLRRHFRNNAELYRGHDRLVLRIKAKKIRRTPKRMVRYTLKAILRHRATLDDLIVLPRAEEEFPVA